MSSYPLLDVFLTMLWFFLWVLWFFLVIWVLIDVFRNDDIGGWGKAGWTVLVVFLPLLGVLIYTVIHGHEMTERGLSAGPVEPEETSDTTTSSTTASSELSKLADLHDRGVISDEEFARGKEKILH